MVEALLVLFAVLMSLVVGAMLEVLVIEVPEAVPALTFTTSGKFTDAPDKISPVQSPAAPGQQLIAPVPPTAGSVLQIHPVGIANETNVVFVGTDSVNTAPVAEFGPALVTV
jgi:hypothetical protein